MTSLCLPAGSSGLDETPERLRVIRLAQVEQFAAALQRDGVVATAVTRSGAFATTLSRAASGLPASFFSSL